VPKEEVHKNQSDAQKRQDLDEGDTQDLPEASIKLTTIGDHASPWIEQRRQQTESGSTLR